MEEKEVRSCQQGRYRMYIGKVIVAKPVGGLGGKKRAKAGNPTDGLLNRREGIA